jgi:hypothetical protein
LRAWDGKAVHKINLGASSLVYLLLTQQVLRLLQLKLVKLCRCALSRCRSVKLLLPLLIEESLLVELLNVAQRHPCRRRKCHVNLKEAP